MKSLSGCPGQRVRRKSYIVAFLHVFSPGCTKAFFPIRALFGAASAGEWARLAVLIAHMYFAQQIGSENYLSTQIIAWGKFACAMRYVFAPVRHGAKAPDFKTCKARASNYVA